MRAVCLLGGHLLAVWLGLTAAAVAEEARFAAARPVWLKGRELEKNVSIGLRAVVDVAPAQIAQARLRVTAAYVYRATVNGQFLGHGPARGPHGFYRVDEWPLAGLLRPGKNVVAIEAPGYSVNSFALLDQPSFVEAEVTSGDQVLAATGGAGPTFAAQPIEYRVQKVQRYSFQRPFIEVYRLTPESQRWRSDPAAPLASAELAEQPQKQLLPRRVLAPDFAVVRPIAEVGAGRVEPVALPQKPWKDRSLTQISPKLKGYAQDELEVIPSLDLQKLASRPTAAAPRSLVSDARLELAPAEYRIVDFGANRTGFLGLTVECREPCRLYLTFDEILSDGDVDFRRLGCVNAVQYDLAPGRYDVETIEPYTLRYLKLICASGRCTASGPLLREYAHPPVAARFAASDERLNKLFEAGVQTFRQNSLDVFMDCPSRERAGWLCDSFFTARAAAALTGQALVERNFVENFLLPKQFPCLPEGMLPMCYPSDHSDGVFIPNWAMWFVIELEEYAARSGDRATVEALRGRVLRLFDYFRPFENEDGLLEKLKSWVFIEWSEANKFVQDVNYPSNMLYAATLAAAGRLYGLPELGAKAAKLRDTIRRQSFDGQFFVDNAVRKDGKLVVTRNRSEVCQYFAFFFQVANRDTHAPLWKILRDDFGPERKRTKAWPEVHLANSFIGNMLRMELLSDAGRSQQFLDESISYLMYMAERTGTLWEHTSPKASCNHGFASHIVYTLYRDVLGVRRIDPTAKTVQIKIPAVPLAWCEGTLPTAAGPLHLRWWKEGGAVRQRLDLPAGYRAVKE